VLQINLYLLQNVDVLHANEAEAKNDRGGEKVNWSGGDAGGSGCSKGGGVGGGCSLYFSHVSSVSLLSHPILCLFFVVCSSSPLSLHGCQWRLEMAVSAVVRWCAVAVERKHSGSCGCSSSSVFFLPLSLPVLPRFFDGFPFSPLSSLSVSLLFLFFPLISSVSVCFSSLLSL